ncbi:hypothetical protein SSP531S_28410 [Streptomyces spongiicola]|uniref:Uncharacterized protein n=1 Tax=Streptomyces spongiicola TaxID=1690221 RepID=A0A388SXP0_9ACTN|nr:hypothetical protein SSP531S_28410 [Streptomyces spongiicola]
MIDDNNPELTPEQQASQVTEQQTEDSDRIESVFGATDSYQRMTAVMDDTAFGIRGGLFGRTDFEGADLNAMLDLLEASNPSDLENAGKELGKARDALNAAAQELDDYVKRVHWEGESGREFRRYGTELAKYAWSLGSFANSVSTQMEVAGTGLTSVRGAKPPRDGRLVRRRVEDFAAPERRADNPEYAEAMRVEEHRQEAINQMNRLASFYAVSEESLSAQEPPRMPKMLQADVPRPTGGARGAAAGTGASVAEASGAVAQHPGRDQAHRQGADAATRADVPGSASTALERSTSMEIDSATAPQAAPTASRAPSTPTATAASGTPSGLVGSLPPSFGAPVRNSSPRVGTSVTPRAGGGAGASIHGRSVTPGGGASAGRVGAVGRAGVFGATPAGSDGQGVAGRASSPTASGTAPGRSGATGATGSQGEAAGRQAVPGRYGAGLPAGSPSPGARAGRVDGVVGGTPQRSAAGSSGARIPRGTVIGVDGPGPGRSSAGRTPPGVVGAISGNTPQRRTGRGTPSGSEVEGTPRDGARPLRPSGPSSDPGQRRPRERDGESAGSSRPDYLAEDKETWTARRRGAVPPVVE